jgi:glycosyltransferase involved in cell wall biosynthesis
MRNLDADPSVDVSVVIPTFRRPAQVVEAVRSALAQEGTRVEVIVLDDSPEGSARTAVEGLLDPRVTYRLRDAPSGGNPSRVRNDGWPQARGRFVHFLDDDDHAAPGAYRDVVRAFDAHPEVGVVYGRVEPFGDDPAAVLRERRVFSAAARRARIYERIGSPLLVVANQLFAGTVTVNSACVIRRELVAPLGGYDEELRLCEDLEFYVRAMRAYGCAFVDRPVAEYRTGAPSLMNAGMADGKVASVYGRIYGKYRAEHGRAELFALKLLGKTVLRWL